METVSERIKHIIRQLNLNITSFSKSIGLNNNVTIGRIIKENGNPSYEIISKILHKYSFINGHWLLTGEGKMLLRTIEPPPKNFINEPKAKYYTSDQLSDDCKKELELEKIRRTNIEDFLKLTIKQNSKEIRDLNREIGGLQHELALYKKPTNQESKPEPKVKLTSKEV